MEVLDEFKFEEELKKKWARPGEGDEAEAGPLELLTPTQGPQEKQRGGLVAEELRQHSE
ncbi:MAG: hypothetical protein AB7P17_14635 [Nitrospirales bacterium]